MVKCREAGPYPPAPSGRDRGRPPILEMRAQVTVQPGSTTYSTTPVNQPYGPTFKGAEQARYFIVMTQGFDPLREDILLYLF